MTMLTSKGRCFGAGRKARRGFTLLELVVVIFILAILVALLLPGVRRSRGAAQRAQCRNNLKQLGLALHNYHDVYGQFPLPGIVSARMEGAYEVAVGSASSWGTALLPYLDQANLANGYDTKRAAFDPVNRMVVESVVPVFVCPSTPREKNVVEFHLPAGTMVYPMLVTAEDATTRYGACDYMQSSGVASAFRKHAYAGHDPPQGKLGAMDQILIVPDAALGQMLGNPKLARESRISDITDGTSQTMALSECAGRNELWRKGKRVREGEDATAFARQRMMGGGGWADPFNQAWINGRQKDGTGMGGPCAINCSNEPDAGLSSFHSGGAHATLADGAVRFLSEGLNPYVLAGLVTRAGGEEVGEF